MNKKLPTSNHKKKKKKGLETEILYGILFNVIMGWIQHSHPLLPQARLRIHLHQIFETKINHNSQASLHIPI